MKSLLVTLLILPWCLQAATYDSGSDGSDGALNIPGDQGYVLFNPDDFDPALDADRDGIYNFTTITIGEGTFLRLTAEVLGHRPLIWLAQGDVVLNGDLIAWGLSTTAIPFEQTGVGGFPGGDPGEAGQGPGASDDITKSSVHITSTANAAAYGNSFFVPALGGSGASGMVEDDGTKIAKNNGGGSIIIASSTRIAVNGYIGVTAFGLGSSGALRLIAPSIDNDGNVENGGVIDIAYDSISAGRVRFETYDLDPEIVIYYAQYADVTITTPGPAVIEPNLKITKVDSTDIPQKLGASGSDADLTIDAVSSVTVTVAAKGIPLGTTVTIDIWNESLGKFSYTTSGLSGTLEASTASASFEVPPGKNSRALKSRI